MADTPTARVLLDAATRAVETAHEQHLTTAQVVTAAVLRALSAELASAPVDWPDPLDLDDMAGRIERGEA